MLQSLLGGTGTRNVSAEQASPERPLWVCGSALGAEGKICSLCDKKFKSRKIEQPAKTFQELLSLC